MEPATPGILLVKESTMRESNGNVTYYVSLAYSEDALPWDCYSVYSSRVKGRAKYEAARLRHFLGQGPAPNILDFET